MTKVRHALLAEIADYCARMGITDRQFGIRAVDDSRFVERLREGKATLRVIERAEALLHGEAAQLSAPVEAGETAEAA